MVSPTARPVSRIVTTTAPNGSPWMMQGRPGAETLVLNRFPRDIVLSGFITEAERHSKSNTCPSGIGAYFDALKPLDADVDFNYELLSGVSPKARGWILCGLARPGHTDAGIDLNPDVMERLGAENILTAQYQWGSDTPDYVALALLKGNKLNVLRDLVLSPLSGSSRYHYLWNTGGLDTLRLEMITGMTDPQLMSFVNRHTFLGRLYVQEGLIEKMPAVLDQIEATRVGTYNQTENVLRSMLQADTTSAVEVFGQLGRSTQISVIDTWAAYCWPQDRNRDVNHAGIKSASADLIALAGSNPSVRKMFEEGLLVPGNCIHNDLAAFTRDHTTGRR